MRKVHPFDILGPFLLRPAIFRPLTRRAYLFRVSLYMNCISANTIVKYLGRSGMLQSIPNRNLDYSY